MITVWEIYRLDNEDEPVLSNEHVQYYPYHELGKALEHWKSTGRFSAGYGLRLALAKPEWINQG